MTTDANGYVDQEARDDAATDAAELAFDVMLVAAYQGLFPAKYFSDAGDVVESLQCHVERLVRRFGTWPTPAQGAAQASLNAKLAAMVG